MIFKREKASARASSDRFLSCVSPLKPNIFSYPKFVSLLIMYKTKEFPKEFPKESPKNPQKNSQKNFQKNSQGNSSRNSFELEFCT